MEAELLELETTALAFAIKHNIETVKRIESSGNLEAAGTQDPTVKYLEQLAKHGEDMRLTYLDKRLKLGRLKRQIARESKALNEPAREKADLTEMSHRLQALEAKVDQILEALPKAQR